MATTGCFRECTHHGEVLAEVEGDEVRKTRDKLPQRIARDGGTVSQGQRLKASQGGQLSDPSICQALGLKVKLLESRDVGKMSEAFITDLGVSELQGHQPQVLQSQEAIVGETDAAIQVQAGQGLVLL